jgi:hypothetical protein
MIKYITKTRDGERDVFAFVKLLYSENFVLVSESACVTNLFKEHPA